MTYRLLDAFAGLFTRRQYNHRNQTLGNFVASHLYEDLFDLGRSPKLLGGVNTGRLVVSTANLVAGRRGRRGDGTFGEIIPNEVPQPETGFRVKRGPLATILIGAETKILAKAMIKQIDRVMTDLVTQAGTFKQQTPGATTVAIVGINHSDEYTSYEGVRIFPAETPPSREAPKAASRILARVPPAYDETIILRFRATNVAPYPFAWVDQAETRREYGAALLRISKLFDERN